MHPKLLLAESDFYKQVARSVTRRMKLITKLAMLLEEGNTNLRSLNRLRRLLLESRDDFNTLAALVLNDKENIIVDQAFMVKYIAFMYNLQPSRVRVIKLAASVRRAALLGFIGVDLE